MHGPINIRFMVYHIWTQWLFSHVWNDIKHNANNYHVVTVVQEKPSLKTGTDPVPEIKVYNISIHKMKKNP